MVVFYLNAILTYGVPAALSENLVLFFLAINAGACILLFILSTSWIYKKYVKNVERKYNSLRTIAMVASGTLGLFLVLLLLEVLNDIFEFC